MSKVRKQQHNQTFLRADFAPASFDAENLTIEVTFATEVPILRSYWDGSFNEVLSLRSDHVRLDRLNKGAPVLNNHSRWNGLSDQIGTVERAWLDGNVGKAILRFSRRDDVAPIIQDVKDGIIKNVSVGYRVYKFVESASGEGQIPTYRAEDWEPTEISLVTVPADANAQIRSNGTEYHEVTIISQLEADRQMANEQNPTPPAQPTQPVNPPVVDTTEVAKRAEDAERTRVKTIINLARKFNVSEELETRMIDENYSIEAARAAILDTLEGQQKPITSHTTGAKPSVGKDPADAFRNDMEAAILSRAGGEKCANDNPFGKMTLMRMAAICLERAGRNTALMSNQEIAHEAMRMHSTSDFPLILGNTINRTLRAAYDLQPRTFQPFVTRRTVTDFRPITSVQLGQLGALKEVPEGAEYEYVTVGESQETYRLKKFGERVAFTWEMLLQDDLSAFNRVPQLIANQIAQMQSNIVYGILLNNPKMGDGTPLFHASHGNIAATGSSLDETALDAAYQAFGAQTDIDGKTPINITPRILLVGYARRLAAQKMMSNNFTPNTTGEINTFANAMDIIVESRITGNKFFLFASPNQVPTIETAVLDGEGDFRTWTEENRDRDGIDVKVRATFAAKALDWRGMYYNAGN